MGDGRVGSLTAATDSNPPGDLYCATCERTFHIGERCPVDGARLMKLKARIDPFIGRDIDGRFTVLEKLGQGGMGAVYRAEQHSVGREVAIKVVNQGLVSDPDVIKRFLREAKLASQLSHPNAVNVLDFGQTDDGVFYLVMELVSGRTLDQVIKAERVFRPERVVRIGTQICDALDAAHARSIIHRDLKPANVMLLAQGRDLVKVLDFGLAKSVSPDATSTTMTGAGAIVGTPAFMPPELATGMPCDGRADLYSLGCMLYLLGSGRLPFHSDSVHELLAMHGCDDPAPPMTGVPQRLAKVVGKLLEKDPRNRFQSAAEALQALEMSMSTRTPVSGVAYYAPDTQPSLGPFPATTETFAHLETPLPPSVAAERAALGKGERKPRSATEVERMISGATMLAASASPVAATSQPSTSLAEMTPRRRSRWPLIALACGALIASIVGFAVVSSGGEDTPARPPVVDTRPAVVDPRPAVIVPRPAVVHPRPPVVDTKPPVAVEPEPAAVIAPKPPVTKPKKTVKTVKPPKPPTTTPTTNPTSKPATGSGGPKPPAVLPF
ncbi:MAG: Serine/threonine protein kinase [Myxococcales bacterium]|nr:Serine/threonine protein kinase [Myxococcales bacterium]